MKDEIFKKLIQSIDLDEPRASFTDDIMKMVENEEELSLNSTLHSVIKTELIVEPSFDFSNSVMAEIQTQEARVSEPMITQKAKSIILCFGICLLLFAVINSVSTFHLQKNSYISNFDLNFTDVATGIIKIAISVFPYLIPLSVLLFIDYLFKTRQRQLS